MTLLPTLIAGGAPLDYISGASGPAATPTLWLNWLFSAICVAVCLIVAGLLLGAILRRRTGVDTLVRRESSGLHWITIGAGVSTAVLFFMAIIAFVALRSVAAPRQQPDIVITVTGYDWWWKADYGDFQTANEIHIPTGVPVRIQLQSADVIHAFWVPQLAGKTEMIPGVRNTQWLQADKPGVYRGQCTQFCGLQHAHMAFEVVADTPQAFIAWREAQSRPAVATGPGQDIFDAQCGGCHTVRGSDARGVHGPDLTHLMSRRQIAAGMFDTSPQSVMDWVAHAQELKAGSRMPDFALTPADRAALLAYLTELR